MELPGEVVVQLLSRVQLFVTPLKSACQTSQSLTISQSILQLTSIELMILSKQLILCQPFLLLPVMFPSIRVFSTELTLCISWPTYWSFNFSISSSNEYSRLISFGIEWIELLAAQGTLKSLLQHHISKWSILRHSTFFMVQLSLLYMITGKTIVLTKQLWPLFAKLCLCFWMCCLGLS